MSVDFSLLKDHGNCTVQPYLNYFRHMSVQKPLCKRYSMFLCRRSGAAAPSVVGSRGGIRNTPRHLLHTLRCGKVWTGFGASAPMPVPIFIVKIHLTKYHINIMRFPSAEKELSALMATNLALYRKYRPVTFGQVVGQSSITTALSGQVPRVRSPMPICSPAPAAPARPPARAFSPAPSAARIRRTASPATSVPPAVPS